MDGSDCIRRELTSRDRIEEVQGQEEINAMTCINRKRCIVYGINVQKLAFGKRHWSAKSFGWLSIAESYSPDSCSRMQRVRPPRKPLLRIEVLGTRYRVEFGDRNF
jgi:hypothetical protein